MKQLTCFYQKNSSRIIAAIPAYNVEQFIGDIASKAKRYVDKVIVIDNGSTDNTAHVAEASGAQLVMHKVNRGAKAAKSCFEAGKR